MGKKVERVLSVINSLTKWLGATVIVVIMLVMVSDAISRRVFVHSLTWALGFVEWTMPALAFLVFAYILQQGGHPSLDLVVTRLSERTRNILSIVTSVAGLTLFAAYVYIGSIYTWDALQEGYRIPGYPFPYWPAYLTIPLGSVLVCLQFLIEIWHRIRNLREEVSSLQ